MIVCLSANHKTASLPMLESLSFKHKDEATKKCCSLESVKEAVILQTCNRVEIYVATEEDGPGKIAGSIVGFWSQEVGISSDVIGDLAEVFYGNEALLHLLQLASGLESLVIGEDEILGQVRMAYVESRNIGTANSLLEKAFMKAVNVGRRVRSETRIDEGSVSVSSVAVGLAEKKFGDLKNVRTLIVGAGEAASLLAEELRRRGAETIHIANRTIEKGRELAQKVGGKAIPLQQIYDELRTIDLGMFAVSVDRPLLSLEKSKKTLLSRKNHDLILIDISQPRCVEDTVSSLPGVDLRNVDDLKLLVEENTRRRSVEAEKVRRIVQEELGNLETQLGRLLSEPLVSAMFIRANRIREQELTKALRMIGNVSQEQKVVIENLTKELAERILQQPVESLRKSALNRDATLMAAAKKLFELDQVN